LLIKVKKIFSIKNSLKQDVLSPLFLNCAVQYVIRRVSGKPEWLEIKWYTMVQHTVFLPVLLYGCETWSPTLREERWLRVFEDMVLRKIFGPTKDEVTGEWRKLNNEELNNLYSSTNIIRVIKSIMGWALNVARMGRAEVRTGFW
jgi:hypothetical protein